MRVKANNIYSFLRGIIFVILLVSCDKIAQYNIDPDVPWVPVRADMEDQVMVLIQNFPSGGYRNLIIRNIDDEDKKMIVLRQAEVNKRRIVILPKGNYEFSADNVSDNEKFDLQEDCIIRFESNKFKQLELNIPSDIDIIFLNNNKNIIKQPVDDVPFLLSILNMEILDETPIEKYTVKIGDVEIKLNNVWEENYRIISEEVIRLPYQERPYNLTVTVNGKSDSFQFYVIPIPIPLLTVTNIWKDRPIQFAEMEYFIVSRDALSANDRSILERRGYLEDDEYNNIANKFGRLSKGSNDEPYVYTNDRGIIEIQDVNRNDLLVLALSGYPNYDPEIRQDLKWYTQIIPIMRDEISVVWPYDDDPRGTRGLPSKGEDRRFVVEKGSIPDSIWEDMDRNYDYSVWLYYKPGERTDTISRFSVLDDWSYERIPLPSVRIVGNRLIAAGDLSSLCLATQINYLIQVERSTGSFIMDNITYEHSPPLILRAE